MESDQATATPITPEALLPLIRAGYDLPEPVTCGWLSSGLNDVFEVVTGAGPFALKLYRAGWRSREEVAAELAALGHLHRKGVPVAPPVPRRDGQTLWGLPAAAARSSSRLPERVAVLFAWARGEPVTDLDPSRCRLLGRALAGIHAATDDFTASPVRYDMEGLLARPMAELGPFLEDRAEAFPGALEYLSGLAGRLGGRLAGLPQPMDWGYCHGDFRAANLRLYDDAGAVTAFDFELGGTGFRAYDLAYFRASTLHPVALEALWGGAPEPEDHEASWQAFVEGYAGRRPLSPADLWAVPLLVALWALRMLGDIARASEAARRGGSGGGVAEVWPPIPPGGGLPGGDLFERTLRFLRDWEASCL